MNSTRLLFTLLVFGASAATSLRAQLMELSFDVGTHFRQDYVNTDLYFMLPEGTAHFDFRFNPERPLAGDDFVRIRVTNPEGGLVFDEHRALDLVGAPTEEYPRYFFGFTEQRNDGPNDRRFYENLNLELSIGPGWIDEDGNVIPPDVQIDSYSELYVYGWSPMIQYVPPGHGGEFNFDEEATNVTQRFVPVPEPSTYGLAALGMLAGAAGWRRWRTSRRGALG